MSQISAKFESLGLDGRKGFIPFVTAGDPDLETSLSIVLKLAEMGADVIELGVPFTDPMADGPTIQRSSQRALDGRTTLADVLELAAQFRKNSDVPIVLFSYFNPILRFGIESFVTAAKASGINGVLLTDVIENEAQAISDRFAENDIDLISLIAPTTTDKRLEKICENAKGFIYAVSRAGVTGTQQETSSAAETLVNRARQFTDLPIAVGFGISTAEQIKEVWQYADAAVVGSAIVAEIELAEDPGAAVKAVEDFIAKLLPSFAKGDTKI
ncbi:MAG: tryptophan synthase subunit alpha [Pyrinomonadaceae bacterium]